MENIGAQQLLFQHIKGILPGHLSMVDEIARVLDVSNDSAYRRIRGEKPITLEETKLLCNQFKISLDQLLHLDTDAVIFSGRRADPGTFNFEKYLEDFLAQHRLINSFDTKELLILPKDVPVYHYYNFPELAAFKYFFWMKTILRYPEYSRNRFDPGKMEGNLIHMGELILEEYNKIPSTEIWNVENINTTLRQIDYYKQTGVFSSEEDVFRIYDCLEKVIDHVEAQAEAGYKSTYGKKESSKGAAFNLYINDFILGDNMYMPILNGNRIVFMTHAFLNYMGTRDTSFADYTYRHFQNIVNKSTLVSVVGERDRRSFFNKIRANINSRKNTVAYT